MEVGLKLASWSPSEIAMLRLLLTLSRYKYSHCYNAIELFFPKVFFVTRKAGRLGLIDLQFAILPSLIHERQEIFLVLGRASFQFPCCEVVESFRRDKCLKLFKGSKLLRS
jgi:hypothetical protein